MQLQLLTDEEINQGSRPLTESEMRQIDRVLAEGYLSYFERFPEEWDELPEE